VQLYEINIYQLCNFNNDSTEAEKLGMNTQNKRINIYQLCNIKIIIILTKFTLNIENNTNLDDRKLKFLLINFQLITEQSNIHIIILKKGNIT
jgi:hypothetical protein